ncbi:MAG TPA: hypothetical protein VFG48_00780, partial [Xanthomonadales bacterium]|nr:hypothetical protein [Xanthomonadales bacterium]
MSTIEFRTRAAAAPRQLFALNRILLILLIAVPPAFATAALAQEQDAEEAASSSSILMEEVTVTARKREESIQQVPVSISAYSGDQIETLKVRDLKGLSVAMPNVAMDD